MESVTDARISKLKTALITAVGAEKDDFFTLSCNKRRHMLRSSLDPFLLTLEIDSSVHV
jgi:hypothetical protein